MDNLDLKNNILKEKILNLYKNEGFFDTPIKGFKVSRIHKTSDLKCCFYKPMIIFVLQGTKHTIFGNEIFDFGEKQYVISTVDIPTMSRVTSASEEKPFLALVLDINSLLIAEIMAETQMSEANDEKVSFFSVDNADEYLTDAFLRLTELTEQPESKQKILAPMIIKEIHYLLLSGPLGHQLRAVNTKGTQSNQIADAINILKVNFKEKVNMDKLAQDVNMASSSFYRHFKKVTTISPLQYQKQLRLYEAQRLMLTGNYDAQSASFIVGYESPTQFSREYKKLFGNPPKSDIKKLSSV